MEKETKCPEVGSIEWQRDEAMRLLSEARDYSLPLGLADEIDSLLNGEWGPDNGV